MSKTTRGTVIIALGDKELTLKPTLDAVRKIEARFGGLRGALQAAGELSIEATSHIIAAGAGLKPDAAKALPEQVFQAGVSDVSPQLVPYILFLMNPSQKDEADEGNGQSDAAQ